MPIEYRIRVDEEYVATVRARYRSQNRGDRWLLVVKLICGLILGGLVLLLALGRELVGAGILTFFAVLLALSGRIELWLMPRRLRKRARYGEEVTLVLSDEGIHSRDSLVESRAAWQAFVSARRFSDGWLLFDDRGRPRWLPDAATRSTPEEIETFLGKVLAERVVG